jgi:hypothetical protein
MTWRGRGRKRSRGDPYESDYYEEEEEEEELPLRYMSRRGA